MSIRSLLVLLVVILAALAGCGPDRAADQPATKPKAGAGENEFAQMRRELALSADQEVAFSAKVAARDAALRAWREGPEGKRLEAARRERTAATDDAQRRALDAELTALNQAQWKVRTTYRAEVMQVLTADQQQAWAGARLGERLLSTYGRLGLDEAQQARVRAIASAAVASERADLVADPWLTTALEPARIAAEQRIEGEVLTDGQRATMAERRRQQTGATTNPPAGG